MLKSVNGNIDILAKKIPESAFVSASIAMSGRHATSLTKEIAAFERMRETLEAEHFGEWVVVHSENLVGTFSTFELAADEATPRVGEGPYLIREIGAAPFVLPASVLYGNCIDYLKVHAASFRSVSRVAGVADANAPRRADAPIPDAMMLRAAFRSTLSAWPQTTHVKV